MARLLAVNVGFRATSSGGEKRCTPESGSSRFRIGAWSGDSTSMAMDRAISADTAASTARSWSTRWIRIATGRTHLKRNDFTFGQFGENFTVEGLADDEVCIGDRYRIGGALFEVTQPRTTCYRVGIRLDEPQMAALLVSHHRPGFYFRVLEEGEVGAGDEITKIADGPERMTVAEIDALLYLPGHSRDRLERSLRIPALSPGWRTSFQEMLDQDGSAGPANPAPAWTGFRSLRVAKVDQESASVISVVLRAARCVDVAQCPARPIPDPEASSQVRRAAHSAQLFAIECARWRRLSRQCQAGNKWRREHVLAAASPSG